MKWQRTGEFALTSDCQQFRISKAYVKAQPRYSLWRLGEKSHQLIEVFHGNLAAAQDKAEQMANNQ